MRKKLVVVLAMLCVLAFCMAPAAASSFDQKVNSNGMTVTPIIGNVAWPKSVSTGTVTQGQMVEYTYAMPAGSTTLMVKVEWATTSNNLGLTVVLPDSTRYSFDDYYDSPTPNGRTAVQFQDNPLQSGTWKFHVLGKSVSGSQPFTITVVSS